MRLFDMTTFKPLNPINSFSYLWKVDDESWLKQRKKEWSYLSKNTLSKISSKENKVYKNYYIYGKKQCYIPAITLLFMTPCESGSELELFFNSAVFSYKERKKLYNCYAFDASIYSEGMSWQKKQTKLFVDTILTVKYKEIKEAVGKRSFIISPNASFWCKCFCPKAKQVMNEEIGYHGCIETVDYFISALPYAIDKYHRASINIFSMLELSEEVLTNSSVSVVAKEMAQNLITRKQDILDAWALNVHLD